MAKWTVVDGSDEKGSKSLVVQQGRKKISVKMSEGDADQLVRYILRKFDN
jgi:hypothetical protein